MTNNRKISISSTDHSTNQSSRDHFPNFSGYLSTRKSSTVYLLVVLFTLFYCGVAKSEPLTKVEQDQVYDEAVHILGGNANVISRWVDDINYQIIGSEQFRRVATETLADVANITQLRTTSAELSINSVLDYIENLKESPLGQKILCDNYATDSGEKTCANFVVIQASNETMLELATVIPLRKVYQNALASEQAIPCFFAPVVGPSQVIQLGFVYVNTDLEDTMSQTCLQEEIYQSFGLFNDYSGSTYFSFNNQVTPKQITQYDRALLKTVYDSEFRPGSPVFSVVQKYILNLPLGSK